MTGPNPYTTFSSQQPRPQQMPQPMQYGSQPQMPQTPPTPPPPETNSLPEDEDRKGMTGSKGFLALIIAGVAVFFTGGIISSLLLYEDFITENEQNIFATIVLLMNAGIMMIATGFALAGFLAKNITDKARGAMFALVGTCIFAALLLFFLTIGI